MLLSIQEGNEDWLLSTEWRCHSMTSIIKLLCKGDVLFDSVYWNQIVWVAWNNRHFSQLLRWCLWLGAFMVWFWVKTHCSDSHLLYIHSYIKKNKGKASFEVLIEMLIPFMKASTMDKIVSQEQLLLMSSYWLRFK